MYSDVIAYTVATMEDVAKQNHVTETMSFSQNHSLSGWYNTLFSHFEHNNGTLHVSYYIYSIITCVGGRGGPPGVKAPIKALLQTTWSTRMKFCAHNTPLISMVSPDPD